MAYKKKKIILIVIGTNIRRMRRLKDFTQEDLAERLGLTRVSIVNIEAGRQAIPIYQIPLLCEVLECSPNFLFKK